MIAKSDLIILVVSASALTLGIARWQSNTAAPSSARIEAPAAPTPPTPAITTAAGPTTAIVPPAASGTAPGAVADAAPAALPAASGAVPQGPVSPAGPLVTEAAEDPAYGVHEVVGGDNLGAIAIRFGTSVATLREINGLDGTRILVGQRLRYPSPAN